MRKRWRGGSGCQKAAIRGAAAAKAITKCSGGNQKAGGGAVRKLMQ